jgi:hypothetical protein
MLEKVYCVHDWWDNTIIKGVAKYQNKNYYFNCIFSELNDDWTEEYYLTLLTEEIYNLLLWNWNYWKKWLKQSIIPHPMEYEEERETKSFEEIIEKYGNNDLWKDTEQNYKNDIIINEYLKNKKPDYKLKGVFYGDINGNNTEVEWKK